MFVEDVLLGFGDLRSRLQIEPVRAHLYRLAGRYADARESALDALARPRDVPIDFAELLVPLTIAALDCQDGQPAAAAGRLAGLWRGGRRWGGRTDYPQRFIEELAGCAQMLGREQETADLLATAAARRTAEGKPVSPNRRPIVDAITSPAVGRVLDDDEIQAVADSLAGA